MRSGAGSSKARTQCAQIAVAIDEKLAMTSGAVLLRSRRHVKEQCVGGDHARVADGEHRRIDSVCFRRRESSWRTAVR